MSLLLTSAAFGVEAHSAGGWRYAGWGMTLKELLAAGKSEAVAVTGKSRAAGKKTVLAEIPDYLVAGTAFRVRFFFVAGRLDP